jgi:EAL domain-containing protein (putative c-di-GMP-specific phosphodiesterase class I)
MSLANDAQAPERDDVVALRFRPIFCIDRKNFTSFEVIHEIGAVSSVTAAHASNASTAANLERKLRDQTLQRACSQIGRWNLTSDVRRSLTVNLSVDNITAPSFLRKVEYLNSLFGLHRQLRIRVDASESYVGGGPFLANLAELRKLGVEVCCSGSNSGEDLLSMLEALKPDAFHVGKRQLSLLLRQEPSLFEELMTRADDLDVALCVDGVSEFRECLQWLHSGFRQVQGPVFGGSVTASMAEQLAVPA